MVMPEEKQAIVFVREEISELILLSWTIVIIKHCWLPFILANQDQQFSDLVISVKPGFLPENPLHFQRIN